MWGYWYGYTAAQIELMACDQPLVLYNHKKDDKKKPHKATELELAKAKVRFAQQEEERKARNGEKIKFNFEGFNTNTNK